MPVSLIFVFLALLPLVCCDPVNTVEPVRPAEQYPFEADRVKAAEAIAEIKAMQAAAKTCSENKDPTGWCEPVSISFLPKTASQSSKGQRILVIDQGMQLPAFTRYRTRVLDFLELNADWSYETTKTTLEIPKWSNEILSHIVGDKYRYLPAHAFRGVVDRNRMTPNYGPRHGDLIFGTLADLNPQSEFVVAQLFELPPEFCSSATDEYAKMHLKNYLTSLSNSLIGLIKRYDVNFINMSFGHTVESLQRSWSVACQSPTNTQKIKLTLSLYNEYFYEKIFSLENVVVVQAAAGSSIEPVFDMDGWHFDGRIRAGYIAEKMSQLEPLGGWRYAYVPQELQSNVDYIDIFINSGVDNDEPHEKGPYPMFLTSTGIGSGSPYYNMTTSWAAPLVLSYLIYLKNQSPEKTAREVLQEVKSRREKLMIDPFKHKQFSIFNQNY